MIQSFIRVTASGLALPRQLLHEGFQSKLFNKWEDGNPMQSKTILECQIFQSKDRGTGYCLCHKIFLMGQHLPLQANWV